jgi:EAL domain-containing protein (putative c-di-GMP-specific phosphodiesterase class I)
MAVIGQLHGLGVQLAIDDFGTGYSSLSYLKRFAVQRIKIDQSFVRDLESDPDDAAIVGAILGLADRLGLDTIAEGVETPEQARQLVGMGCCGVQGYLYSRPLPVAAFEAFVQSWKPRPLQ